MVREGTVSVFAPGSTTPTATLTGLDVPWSLAFDANGNLYVANTHSDPNYIGTTVSVFARGSTTPTATLTGLNNPRTMAFDANGNLYVANWGGSDGTTVSEFAPGSTTPTATLTGLDAPWSLAFDSNGNLYVGNTGDNGTGTTVSVFAPGSTTPTATLTGLNNPRALAFDSKGNLYVANFGGSDGTTVSVFAPGSTTPTATLTGLDAPWSLAFDSHGSLYVGNTGDNGTGTTVSKFEMEETFTPTAGGVVIRSSLPDRPMSLGGTNNAVTGINLTDAELAQIYTTASGTVTIGDSARPATSPSRPPRQLRPPGPRPWSSRIPRVRVRSFSTTVPAPARRLNGNGGTIRLTAGSGGVVAASANNAAAEIATTGAIVTLDTIGPIGTSGNRIQFADNADTAQQEVVIGTAKEPSGVYLDGLGSLTLGNIQGGTVNVTVQTNLVVAAGSTFTLSLGGMGGLTKTGPGTVTLSGTNTYTGETTISGGTLAIATASALPSSGLIMIGGGGRLVLGGGSGIGALLGVSSPATSGDAKKSSGTAVSSNATPSSDAATAITAATTSDVAPPITATATSIEAAPLVTVATINAAAMPGTVALPQTIAAHDAILSEPQMETVVASHSAAASALSGPTEAIHVAALAGVVARSAPLSKPTARMTLFHLPPKATLASTFSVETHRTTASLIDAVSASPSASGVATIVTPTSASSLASGVSAHKRRVPSAPREATGSRLLPRAPKGLSCRELDESRAEA